MDKYRKKPVIIEAVQFDGTEECFDRIHTWAGKGEVVYTFQGMNNLPYMWIKTLEGDMRCVLGDWIIKGVNGEFYPCKPDIFLKTYEPV